MAVISHNNGVTFVNIPPSEELCGICRERMDDQNAAYFGHVAGQTSHLFHLACVSPWFAHYPAQPTCPFCRAQVLNAPDFIPKFQSDANEGLYVAAYKNDLQRVLTLLGNGPAIIDYRNMAVCGAASNGNLSMLKAVLRNGPIGIIDRSWSLKTVAEQGRADMARVLLADGPTLEHENYTALWNAVRNNHLEVVLVLRDCGVISERSKAMALALAQDLGLPDIVNALQPNAHRMIVDFGLAVAAVAVVAVAYFARPYFF